MKGFVALALLLVAALFIVGQAIAPLHPLGGEAQALAATTASASPTQTGHFAGEPITLMRDGSGQFHLDTKVNGSDTRMLVDTGADTGALTMDDAQKAGIEVDPNRMVPILRTASGQGYGMLVTLDRFEIGDTELHNVGAVVVRDLGVSLLGQTVLSRLGRVELAGDRMVIEQRP